MDIVDGNSVDVESDEWWESIQTLGVCDGNKIAVKLKNGKEYAFVPVNQAQIALVDEVLKDLMNMGM